MLPGLEAWQIEFLKLLESTTVSPRQQSPASAKVQEGVVPRMLNRGFKEEARPIASYSNRGKLKGPGSRCDESLTQELVKHSAFPMMHKAFTSSISIFLFEFCGRRAYNFDEMENTLKISNLLKTFINDLDQCLKSDKLLSKC